MVAVKSLLAGILVALCGAVVGLIATIVFVKSRFHTGAVTFDVRLIRVPQVWLFLLTLFLAGFAFEFYRLRMAGR